MSFHTKGEGLVWRRGREKDGSVVDFENVRDWRRVEELGVKDERRDESEEGDEMKGEPKHKKIPNVVKRGRELFE
jgi:hypothetical protein